MQDAQWHGSDHHAAFRTIRPSMTNMQKTQWKISKGKIIEIGHDTETQSKLRRWGRCQVAEGLNSRRNLRCDTEMHGSNPTLTCIGKSFSHDSNKPESLLKVGVDIIWA
jgi:hypothetical protein